MRGATPGRFAPRRPRRGKERDLYATSCAPMALAAVMGVSHFAAARVLRDVADVLGETLGTDTTPLTVLLWSVWGLGGSATSFDPATGNVSLENGQLRALFEHLASGGSLGGGRSSTDLPRGMRLASWIRGPGAEGSWLVIAHPPGYRQHVLALEDGKVIAGDSGGRYGPAELIGAYRIERGDS